MAALKKKIANRRGKRVNPDPVFENCEAMTGAEFLHKVRWATDYYRTEYKASDLLPDYFKWLTDNGYEKAQIATIKQHSTHLGVAAIYARCVNSGMPDSHAAGAAHWKTLKGTGGDLRPTSVFLHRTAKTILETDRSNLVSDEIDTLVVPVTPVKTIQDHLQEKAYITMGDLEAMFDEFVEDGMGKTFKQKPFTVLNASKLGPQHINKIIAIWEGMKSELTELQAGTCEQLNEGYAHWGKIQVRNAISFMDVIISDCNSYLQLKKVSKKQRTRKPVSPEKLTRKFKYLKESTELGIKSVKVAELVDAGEAWFYDTKKRKLVHTVADSYTKTFSVKSTTLVGFDVGKTVQKTLRKPAEQLKEFMKLSVPNRRKFFQELKAVEIKYGGRGNDNLLLLAIK